MENGLLSLAAAMTLFVGTHVGMPEPKLRDALTARIGENGYLATYSVISIGLLAWVIIAYKAAPDVEIWIANTGMRHASLTLMLIAAFFLIAGMTTRNPSTVQAKKLGWKPEAKGVFKITRHPVMWAATLWAIAHTLANGDAAAIILFGGIGLLSLLGAAHLDRRKRLALGADWEAFQAETSFVPLGAIATGRARVERGEIPWWQSLGAVAVYMAMLFVHARLGRDVFPIGFF
jgi:uncharacterized membrane protein